MLELSDIVIDTTPKHVAAGNLERYRTAGVKAVFQGGESHATTGHSFVAQANYDSALGRDTTRVVSCNTTSIVRVLGALDNAGLLLRARGVRIRRATDPWESHLGGIMNTMVPEPSIPSHQGPDAQTVLPGLDLVTIAAKGAHTQTHSHFWTLQLTRTATREDVLSALVTVQGDEACLTYQVYNEAIVVPETIDAIRALTGAAPDAATSMRITDETLGMRQDFLDGGAGDRP